MDGVPWCTETLCYVGGWKNTNFNQELTGKKLPLSFKCYSNLFDVLPHLKIPVSPCSELASGGNPGMWVACPSVWRPLAWVPLAVHGWASPGKCTPGHTGMPSSLPAHCPWCQWDSPCWLHQQLDMGRVTSCLGGSAENSKNTLQKSFQFSGAPFSLEGQAFSGREGIKNGP